MLKKNHFKPDVSRLAMRGWTVKLAKIALIVSLSACGQEKRVKSRPQADLQKDGNGPVINEPSATPPATRQPSTTASPVPCLARPAANEKFNFVLGGQSNAVLLGSTGLLDASLRLEFDGVISPANLSVLSYARNGTNLAVDWKANGSAAANGDGQVYRTFQEKLLPRLRVAPAAKPSVAGMFWLQGESDSRIETHAKAYEANLKTFIADIRATFQAPNLPFILGRLSMRQAVPAFVYRDTIRSAQEQAGKDMTNVNVIDTDQAEVGDQKAHFSNAGFKIIAAAFARAMKNSMFPGLDEGLVFCN